MFLMSQLAPRHAVLLLLQHGWRKRWMEGWTKTKPICKQPPGGPGTSSGASVPMSSKEHGHAGHAEQPNLYIHPGASACSSPTHPSAKPSLTFLTSFLGKREETRGSPVTQKQHQFIANSFIFSPQNEPGQGCT